MAFATGFEEENLDVIMKSLTHSTKTSYTFQDVVEEEETTEEVTGTVEEVTTEEETTEEPEEVENTSGLAQSRSEPLDAFSNELYDCQIAIDGEIYQLPMWISDFEGMGWKPYKHKDDEMVGADNFAINFWERNGIVVQVKVVNKGVNECATADCEVGGLELSEYYMRDISNDEIDIEFKDGIKLYEATEEDIIAAYGEPTRLYEGSLYTALTYEKELRRAMEFQVYNESGVLENFSIDNWLPLEGADTSVSSEVPDNVKNYTAPKKLSGDPLDYQIQLDGYVYQLPCPLSEFLDNGWKMKDGTADSLSGHDGDNLYMTYDNQKISFSIMNYNKNAVSIENTFVTSVSIGKEDKIDTGISGNLEKGMKEDKLVSGFEALGYELIKNECVNDRNSAYTFKNESQSRNRYDFTLTDGVLTDIYIYNSPEDFYVW